LLGQDLELSDKDKFIKPQADIIQLYLFTFSNGIKSKQKLILFDITEAENSLEKMKG